MAPKGFLFSNLDVGVSRHPRGVCNSLKLSNFHPELVSLHDWNRQHWTRRFTQHALRDAAPQGVEEAMVTSRGHNDDICVDFLGDRNNCFDNGPLPHFNRAFEPVGIRGREGPTWSG
jgi:hypothetical protein